MIPLSRISVRALCDVRFVLTDLDDTITREGRLSGSTYASLHALEKTGKIVVVVTGGPSGWCDMIARMWPVAAAVAESGAVSFWKDKTAGALKSLAFPGAIPVAGNAKLNSIRDEILRRWPASRIAKNQFCRIYDMAIDYAEDEPELPRETALQMKAFAESEGARTGLSSIHLNMWSGSYDKVSGVEYFLGERYGFDAHRDRGSVLYVGDSMNDEPMFREFPLSVGVANVMRHVAEMKSPPAYVTDREYGEGFTELVDTICAACRPLA